MYTHTPNELSAAGALDVVRVWAMGQLFDQPNNITTSTVEHRLNQLRWMTEQVGTIGREQVYRMMKRSQSMPTLKERFYQKYRLRLMRDAVNRGDLDELQRLRQLKFPSDCQ